MSTDAVDSRRHYQTCVIPYRTFNRHMELSTIITFVIVSGILLFSVAISLGIGAKIEKIYKVIQTYIRRIPVGTSITISLLITAVLLAIVASM